MSALRGLVEDAVSPEEIDHLGHLNVHFYAARATQATRALAAAHGLDAAACEARGAVLAVTESFTRHYREQLEGAPLAVAGGVLSAEPEALQLYHELRNRDTGELSATFVHRVELRGRERREPSPFPEPFLCSTRGWSVAWPEHGRPRSIDLARLPTGISLATARVRGLAMRAPRVIGAEECDADGWFDPVRILDLFWAGDPTRPRGSNVPLFDAEDGATFGWATLESRNALLEMPRAGTRIQSFSAEVHLARKTSFRHLWVFDLAREQLLATASLVNLAFDVRARRAIEIPAPMRAALEADQHPDLA